MVMESLDNHAESRYILQETFFPLAWLRPRLQPLISRLFLPKPKRLLHGSGEFAHQRVVRLVWWQIETIKTECECQPKYNRCRQQEMIKHTKYDSSAAP